MQATHVNTLQTNECNYLVMIVKSKLHPALLFTGEFLIPIYIILAWLLALSKENLYETTQQVELAIAIDF